MLEDFEHNIIEERIATMDLSVLDILLRTERLVKILFGAQLIMLYLGKTMRLAGRFCRRLLLGSFRN